MLSVACVVLVLHVLSLMDVCNITIVCGELNEVFANDPGDCSMLYLLHDFCSNVN